MKIKTISKKQREWLPSFMFKLNTSKYKAVLITPFFGLGLTIQDAIHGK